MSLSNPSNPLKASGSSVVSPVTTLPVKAPLGVIVWWSGTVDNIPTGWHLCDGEAGTIDLRDKFVLAAGDTHSVGETGGSEEVTLTVDQMPSHEHGIFTRITSGNSGGSYCFIANKEVVNSFTRMSNATGGGKSHSNMPPYYTLCAIQKIAPDETDAANISFDDTMQANADGSYGVTTPVRSITQAEYDALTDKSGFYIITDAEGTTPDPNGVAITLFQTLPDGGTVTGGGIASKGMTVTVNAEPADDYIFNGWKEGDETVTNESSYSFLVENNRSLMADFSAIHYIAGVDWMKITLPSNANWRSITYGGNKFVALAYESNQAAYSFNGINWTETALPSSANWRSIAYGDNKFVTIVYDSNKAAYSSDGINWTETALPSSANWRSITYGDNKFVAIAYASYKVAYSSDGINWTETTLLPSSANWYGITYGDNKFVAVANGSNQAIYSSNGINWTETTLPSSAKWYSIAYGDNKFVTIAYNSNKVAYSSDGINWTETTLPFSARWCSITYGDNKFVAIANSSNQAVYSSDGINWTEATLSSTATWYDIAYGDNKFVAVAYSTNQATYSQTI